MVRSRVMGERMLSEGMRANDLKGMVLPLMSVDEYQSKVDPKTAIVFGFYVHDKDAAADLNRFVQKSPVSILDTEVSPAPDQHGFFIVFVELLHNGKLGENVAALLDEISPLADIDEWRMRVRKTKGLQVFDAKRLAHALKVLDDDDEAEAKSEDGDDEDQADAVSDETGDAAETGDDLKEDEGDAEEFPVMRQRVLEFLRRSELDRVGFDDDDLIMQTRAGTMRFEVKGFGEPETVMETLGLDKTPIGMSMRESVRSNRLAAVLGGQWSVTALTNVIVLSAPHDDSVLVLRKL